MNWFKTKSAIIIENWFSCSLNFINLFLYWFSFVFRITIFVYFEFESKNFWNFFLFLLFTIFCCCLFVSSFDWVFLALFLFKLFCKNERLSTFPAGWCKCFQILSSIFIVRMAGKQRTNTNKQIEVPDLHCILDENHFGEDLKS